MQPPKIDNSTKEERLAYVLEAWKCLHDCEEVLRLIEAGKIDTTPLITHRFPLSEIEEAYRIFENKLDGVIKLAII